MLDVCSTYMGYARRMTLVERSSFTGPCPTLVPFTYDAEFNHDDTVNV